MNFSDLSPEGKRKAITKLYENGFTLREIAKKLNTNWEKISNFNSRNGLGLNFIKNSNRSVLAKYTTEELLQLFESVGSFYALGMILDIDAGSIINYLNRKGVRSLFQTNSKYYKHKEEHTQ